jgi:ribosomal protein S18 acetylase RimI-like enzyme
MEERLVFRKATRDNLEAVTSLFHSAIAAMEKNGIFQWDDLYPNEDDIRQDIGKEQMYLGTIGQNIASVFALSTECDGQYANSSWKYPDSPYSVVHRLCVSPAFQNKGIGTRTMDYIETMLRESGIETVRLDAFSKNPSALRLYEKRGYWRVGTANWRKGLFYLFEKKL